MPNRIEPQTDWADTGDEVVIRLHLDDMNETPIVHVEDFGTLLRVRGQDQQRKRHAFSKTIPITKGSGRPTASLRDGLLLIRVKKPSPVDQPTIPNS
jgi:HSP20 family molecular chaperone IbpA